MATGKFLKIKLGGDADAVRLREERKDRAGHEARVSELEAKLSELQGRYDQRGRVIEAVSDDKAAADRNSEKLVEALHATVYALDTMYRVARAYAQPTGTSIDGESTGRYALAVREEAKARELFEPILRARMESRS